MINNYTMFTFMLNKVTQMHLFKEIILLVLLSCKLSRERVSYPIIHDTNIHDHDGLTKYMTIHVHVVYLQRTSVIISYRLPSRMFDAL